VLLKGMSNLSSLMVRYLAMARCGPITEGHRIRTPGQSPALGAGMINP
jgi:hypothetical protein